MTDREPNDDHIADPTGRTGPSRRGIVAAAAWSIPVIAVASATPAHATSANSSLTVDVVKTSITAAGASGANASAVTVTVLDSKGRPWAGQPVTLSVGAGRTTLAAVTGTTNAAGQFSTTLTAADDAAGGVRTVTATSDVLTATDTVTVLGSNVVAVGSNGNGQLGDGTPANKSTAVFTLRVFPSPVSKVASGTNFTLYLLENGTVWSVGANANGQLGLGSTTNATSPTQIPGLTGVTDIAAAESAGYAVLSSGQVRSWGLNSSGQLGDGTTTNRTSPVTVRAVGGAAGSALTGVTQVVAGGETVYALAGGQVRSWGLNAQGQAGDGTTVNRLSPVTVISAAGATTPLTGVTQLAGGDNTGYALLSSGQVRSWGLGAAGQLGDNIAATGRFVTAPVTVVSTTGTGALTGVTQIAASGQSAYALTGGQVRSWGVGLNGQLGNGGTTAAAAPVVVQAVGGGSALTGVAEISSGFLNGYARLTSGAVVGWGPNNAGQLGTGATGGNQTTPVSFVLPAGRTARALAETGSRAAPAGFGGIAVILTP